MDGVASPADQQKLVSSFLDIAVGQSEDTARQFLQAARWRLEEAISLFCIRYSDYEQSVPVESEVLPAGSSSREEVNSYGVWELENKSASTADDSQDDRVDLSALFFLGTFEKAKKAAREQNKWLLVNLQSTLEYTSNTLNRYTWANEVVSGTIKTYFIFWQVYDDTEEVKKVSTCYDLKRKPVVLVINPVTDQKMWSWAGMIEPEQLIEELSPYMDVSPNDHHSSLPHKRESHRAPTRHVPDDERVDDDLARAMTASMGDVKDVDESHWNEKDESSLKDPPGDGGVSSSSIIITPSTYLPPPNPGLCRVGMRLPYGRRIQRDFLLSDPIQLLWSECKSELEEQDKARPFLLSLPVPGSEIPLDFNTSKTIEEAGLAYRMLSATWE